MKILVVAQEFPFPANHGGRADVWRRLRALSLLGAEVSLICWYDDVAEKQPSAEALAAVRDVVKQLWVFPIRQGRKALFNRLLQVAKGWPSHAASRWLYEPEWSVLLQELGSKQFDAILLDCPYGAGTALRLQEQLGIPLFYRSHNIEHHYFTGQAKAATSLRNKLAWSFACLNLQKLERTILERASHYFDISADDLRFWQQQGFTQGSWLPPLPELALSGEGQTTETQVQPDSVGFLGNLNAPNNVQGLAWLVHDVMPTIWAARSQVRLVIAGSNPSAEAKQLLASDPRITLVANVPDAPAFMAAQSVLVNPVLSGSGVNVKTLDMLMTSRPLVSTPQGVAGLAPSLQALCSVSIHAKEFAQQILVALDEPQFDMQARQKGRELFSIRAIESIMQVMQAASSKH